LMRIMFFVCPNVSTRCQNNLKNKCLGTTFEQGATLGIAYFTAYRALFIKTTAQAGQTVLVHGASGGVGLGKLKINKYKANWVLAACLLAKVHGCRVWGTASTPEGEKLAREHGCEEVFNHSEPDYIEKIQAAVPNGKFLPYFDL
jgi:NADPH2:quinone reductase